MSSGLLKIEDFCPISENKALVCHGPSYNFLNEILEVEYKIRGEIILKNPKQIRKGTYLRLGNYFNGKLTYSDNYSVYEDDIFKYEGIQPYRFEKGFLYQHHGAILLNDEILINRFKDYLVVGRPTYYDNKVYFETRKSEAPKGWEIWNMDLSTNEFKFIVNGGNPFCYNGVMFYSSWNGSEFDLCKI